MAAQIPDSRAVQRTIAILLGGKIREEDSPGNYLIRDRDGQLEFVVFDMLGAEQAWGNLPVKARK